MSSARVTLLLLKFAAFSMFLVPFCKFNNLVKEHFFLILALQMQRKLCCRRADERRDEKQTSLALLSRERQENYV